MLIKSFLAFTLIASTTLAYASDDSDVEYKNAEEMLGAIHLEKKQIESMVEKMVESGRISKEDGSRARREIASLQDSDLENLKSKALAEIKTNHLLER
jgi:polyhydroxyalkanoate synthesis regulator phasin